MPSVHPHLWFTDKVEEAARFHISLLPDSRIDSIRTMPTDTPSGPEGSVVVIEYTLAGHPFMAMQAGKMDPFNHAVSFMIECDTQAEIDRLWDALSDGGQQEQCGWVRDRYGVIWQVTPKMLNEGMKSPDRAAAKRMADAMMEMVKLDIATLQKAFDGA
jgi:predicted 3-demethylubiquinone-9 3-methyltransferase (glyoxalase superfamily)